MYLADNYDGAILDIMMPKMDGITVLKNIRAQGNDVPVLILTARSEVDDRVLGLDSGADDYLSKPFAAKELLAANPVQEVPVSVCPEHRQSCRRTKARLAQKPKQETD